MTTETEYQRAWRERGEVEAALRKWNNNQRPEGMTIVISSIAGAASLGIIAAFIADPSWVAAPLLLLAAMFGALPLLTPSLLRDQRKARAEAKATLERLNAWKVRP